MKSEITITVDGDSFGMTCNGVASDIVKGLLIALAKTEHDNRRPEISNEEITVNTMLAFKMCLDGVSQE